MAMKTYAAYYDNEVRIKSSSGGVFSLLAAEFEVIYGVVMSENCHSAEFRRITGNIAPLRGSKYFQAEVGTAYRQVKQDLEEGRRVLFSGTGCQINGLKLFLQKEYENLLTVDVICHGVPSPKLWNHYAAYREAQFGEKLKQVDFRCKEQGWEDFGMKENGHYFPMKTDPFMQMFLRNYCLRPSCYHCHAKRMKLADLSIADFWGIQNVVPELNDGLGTSLVIVRTDTGQAIFDQLKPQLKWKEVNYAEGVRSNPAEYRSPVRPKERDTFFKDLDNISFLEMAKKYASPIKIPISTKIRKLARNIRSKIVSWGKI